MALKEADAVNWSNTFLVDATDNVPESMTPLSPVIDVVENNQDGIPSFMSTEAAATAVVVDVVVVVIVVIHILKRRMMEMNNDDKDANCCSFLLRWRSWRRWTRIGGDSGWQQERQRSHDGMRQ